MSIKSKKTVAVKKTQRPPRQVWVVVNNTFDPKHRTIAASATTRAGAMLLREDEGDRVVGPYVLAERVAQR